MEIKEKFRILAEGAKYDVSCSSSGSDRQGKKGSLGFANVGGICHSFTSDGRCISLLKVLMSNNCIYNCRYCANRSSVDVERATFTPRELCELVMGFYRRNYIEGLFLSSAVFRSPDFTMELLIKTVWLLRTEYGFYGYIHMKAIPSCDPKLVDIASKLVDRMSMNVELPSRKSLALLAPDKKHEEIIKPITQLANIYDSQKAGEFGKNKVLPAGQTTQMIIGATADTDGMIVRLAERLYRGYSMKRVYYSAYMPIGDASILPVKPPDLVRENRLYQADWLMRFYGFTAEELLPVNLNLPHDVDPKSAWALRNVDKFPIEINTAPYEMILRVPGIGVKGAWRIIEARRFGNLTFEDLKRMRIVMKRAANFITCGGKYIGDGLGNEFRLRKSLVLPGFAMAGAGAQLTLEESSSVGISEIITQ